jgi:hypothetical protein
MAYPAPRVEMVRENLIRVYHPELIEPQTFLTESVAASDVTLAVQNSSLFSNTDPQDLVLMEELGSDKAEIKRINGAISSNTSLTVQALSFSHGAETMVSKILFNQVELSGATTLAGSKTVISTTNINVSGPYTDLVVTSTTYSFYFVRFYNSLSTTTYFGAYSAGVSSSDLDPNTVGFARRTAFKNVNEAFGGKYDTAWVLDQIFLCELDVQKELKRWSWLTAFNYDLGNVATGLRRIALPSDIEDNQTNKSILGVRIGTFTPMNYVDWSEFTYMMRSIAYTTVATTATIGATSLILTDSRDYDDSGTINIAGTPYTYTANTRSTNTLSGFTAFAAQIDSGSEVWQNATFGLPTMYTVSSGYIYFVTPPSSDYNGRNIYLDYYKKVTRKETDTSTFDVNDPQLVIYWLEMAVKKERANGELPITDSSLLQYQERKKRLKDNEQSGQILTIIPAMPSTGRYSRSWKR